MDDRERVAQLLGRQPRGAFDVVVRDRSGDPVVVRNAPFLDDGTPMPTRYYLVGTDLVRAVSRLEADGGVREAEAAVEADEIAATHQRYATERDATIADDHDGPRPRGGVGGTRQGVKCLHAHLAHHLAGGDDPVGRWTVEHLDASSLDGLVSDALTDVPTEPAGPPETLTGATSPGAVSVRIDDRITEVAVVGGGTFELPIGPSTLVDGGLADHDPPSPVDLTNALGLVHDHLDDLLLANPSIAATPAVTATGPHAAMVARVEVGTDHVPDGYVLERADGEEVFRTLVLETRAQRRFNPGLADDHVESIVGTCCVILGLMRRLDLPRLAIATTVTGAGN